jgi:hypothetical protein
MPESFPTVVSRSRSRSIAIAVSLSGLLIAMCLGVALYFYYHPIWGIPRTPMTVDQANQIISEGLTQGESLERVEAWLADQGIAKGWSLGDRPFYDVLGWRDTEVTSAAKEAGVWEGQLLQTIRISYEDADRSLLFRTAIRVYLFFDTDSRFLKHRVQEAWTGP